MTDSRKSDLYERWVLMRRAAYAGTTPVADTNLERSRQIARRWLTAGGFTFLVGAAIFVAPIVWMLITQW